MSATDIARHLAIRHASASYHLRQLENAGLIETVEINVIRGGRERRYRQRVPDSDDCPRSTWDTVDLRMVIEALHTELARRATRYTPGASAVIDGEYWVPPDVWKQVSKDIRAAALRLHQAAQPASTPESVHVSISALLFQLRPDNGDDDQ